MDVLSKEYMEWLKNNVTESKKFSYNLQYDENIIKIEDLFNRIDEYMTLNYILDDYAESYKFKCDNIGYETGILYGPDNIYYVCKLNNTDECIDINDIRNNIIPEDRKVVLDKLNLIKNNIVSLYELGVSTDIIEDEVSSTVRTLKRGSYGFNSSK